VGTAGAVVGAGAEVAVAAGVQAESSIAPIISRAKDRYDSLTFLILFSFVHSIVAGIRRFPSRRQGISKIISLNYIDIKVQMLDFV
jgi:hypothetical protein